VLALVVALALPACRPLPTTGSTRAALATAGYQVEAVSAQMGPDGSEVDVRVSSSTNEEGQTGTVAGIVWTTVPFRFHRLNVTVEQPQGPQQETFDEAQLSDRFGPRLPGLDRRDYGRDVAALTNGLLAGIALPALVVMGGLGWFVLRSGRRRPAHARRRPG
jgi:hypothetical protein